MPSHGTNHSLSLTSNLKPEQPSEPEEYSPAADLRTKRGLNGTFRSLRHRNYRFYFFGQMISLVGTWMQTTVVLWLAFELTRQSKWPSLIVAAGVVPTFVFGAWGGSLADRMPKRSLIFVTQAIFTVLAFLLAGLVGFGAITPWLLLAVTAATGIVTAIDLPARLAFVIDMVGREDLMNAVALNSLLFNVARALGPAVGGLMLVWLGAWPCFFLNGLSYLAVLWALAQMDIHGATPRRSGERSTQSLWSGFSYMARHREIAFLTLVAGAAAFCAWPSQALMPAFAAHRLNAMAQGYSWLLTATGFGALTAAWVVATFGSIESRTRLIAIGVCLVTIALLGLSLSTFLLLALCCCAFLGFGLILLLSTTQSVIQLSAGEHNRGQIMGIWAMVLSGAVPLGNLLAGAAADLWTEPVILFTQGVVCGGTAVLLYSIFRPWLRANRELPPPTEILAQASEPQSF
jgi:MFS family permease